MKVNKTSIPEVLIIETDVFGDHRGYFTETYNKKRYEEAGITIEFIQDNMSFSTVSGTIKLGGCIIRKIHMHKQNSFLALGGSN